MNNSRRTTDCEEIGKFSSDYGYPIVLRALLPHEGGGYVATIPYLGSATFNGVGETPLEALDCLDENMSHLIPELLSDGWEMPKIWTEEETFHRNLEAIASIGEEL